MGVILRRFTEVLVSLTSALEFLFGDFGDVMDAMVGLSPIFVWVTLGFEEVARLFGAARFFFFGGDDGVSSEEFSRGIGVVGGVTCLMSG